MQLGDGRDGKRRGGLVGTVIGDPLQHVLGAGRRLVEALGRPQHPVPFGRVGFVRKDLQGQKLASVVGAMPADRAVAIGRNDDAPILAGVHRPDLVPARPSPFLRSRVVERCEGEARAEEEALGVRSDGEASRDVIRIEEEAPGRPAWDWFRSASRRSPSRRASARRSDRRSAADLISVSDRTSNLRTGPSEPR